MGIFKKMGQSKLAKKAGKAIKGFGNASDKAYGAVAETFVNPILRAGASFPVSVVQEVQEYAPGGKTGFEPVKTSFGDVKRMRYGTQRENLAAEESEQVKKPGEALVDAAELGTSVPGVAGKLVGKPTLKLLSKADEALGFSKGLKGSAIKKMEEALSPGKEKLKDLTQKIAPEAVERGVRGTLGQISKQAEKGLKEAGEAFEEFGKLEGNTKVAKILDVFEKTKAKFKTAEGVVVESAPVKTMDKLADVIRRASKDGEEISREELRGIRRVWDEVVYGGNKSAKTATEGSVLSLKKEAADSIRNLLADEVPALDKINKDFSFFSDLSKIVDATQTRRVGQTGLVRKGAGMLTGAYLGSAAGKLLGLPGGEFVGAAAGGKAAEAAGSTLFKSWNAATRNVLADALTSGKYNLDKVAGFIQKAGFSALKASDFKRFLNEEATLGDEEIQAAEDEYQNEIDAMRAELLGEDGGEEQETPTFDLSIPENKKEFDAMRAEILGGGF